MLICGSICDRIRPVFCLRYLMRWHFWARHAQILARVSLIRKTFKMVLEIRPTLSIIVRVPTQVKSAIIFLHFISPAGNPRIASCDRLTSEVGRALGICTRLCRHKINSHRSRQQMITCWICSNIDPINDRKRIRFHNNGGRSGSCHGT